MGQNLRMWAGQSFLIPHEVVSSRRLLKLNQESTIMQEGQLKKVRVIGINYKFVHINFDPLEVTDHLKLWVFMSTPLQCLQWNHLAFVSGSA